MDYQVNISRLLTKADHVERYYHYFTAVGISYFDAITIYDDLNKRFPAPAFKVTLEKHNDSYTIFDSEAITYLRKELVH